MKKLGIIGLGFVGNAVYLHYSQYFKTIRLDVDKNKSDFDNLSDFLNENPDYILICLPTPVVDGHSDFSIVGDMCLAIDGEGIKRNIKYNIVIKSTTSPVYLFNLKKRINNSVLITFPEFLSQRTANEDFRDSEFLVFGCEDNKIRDIAIHDLAVGFDELQRVFDYGNIEIPMKFKYAHNVMGAISVLMSNIMYDYINNKFAYYDFKDFLILTKHFTGTYLNVPGHDGQRGFGGACFPKDLISFIEQITHDKNISWEEYELMRIVEDVNNKIRKQE
jgi:UDP-glucose 6-dehydrogenase